MQKAGSLWLIRLYQARFPSGHYEAVNNSMYLILLPAATSPATTTLRGGLNDSSPEPFDPSGHFQGGEGGAGQVEGELPPPPSGLWGWPEVPDRGGSPTFHDYVSQ